jgi:hypothetical protein
MSELGILREKYFQWLSIAKRLWFDSVFVVGGLCLGVLSGVFSICQRTHTLEYGWKVTSDFRPFLLFLCAGIFHWTTLGLNQLMEEL